MYEDLGKRIREQRKRLKMTQEELAEKSEISNSFLGHIERGSRKASLDTLVKLCNALRVSPNILLQDSLDNGLYGADDGYNERQRKFLRELANQVFQYQSGEGEDDSNEDAIIRPDKL